jgi:hypothetical protein
MHEMTYRNEAKLRLMLAASIERKAKAIGGEGGAGGDDVPVRQNRRTPLIEAALAPVRDRLAPTAYARLCAALAMIFGPESMVVFSDVLGLDARAARKIKSWAAQALVRAAIKESASR